MDEPQKHCAKWKKPNTKTYILHDSTSENTQKRPIYRGRKSISGCRGRGGVLKGSGSGPTANRWSVSFWGDECFKTSGRTKTHWVVHFKMVDFVVCEFYLDLKKKNVKEAWVQMFSGERNSNKVEKTFGSFQDNCRIELGCTGFRYEEGRRSGWEKEDDKARPVIVSIRNRKPTYVARVSSGNLCPHLLKSVPASASGGIHSWRTGSQNAKHKPLLSHLWLSIFPLKH